MIDLKIVVKNRVNIDLQIVKQISLATESMTDLKTDINIDL